MCNASEYWQNGAAQYSAFCGGPFQATCSSLTQLATSEDSHQYALRVDEDAARTALGGSKHCVEAWWYAITRLSIKVLGPDTFARKQAGATLGVGEGKQGEREYERVCLSPRSCCDTTSDMLVHMRAWQSRCRICWCSVSCAFAAGGRTRMPYEHKKLAGSLTRRDGGSNITICRICEGRSRPKMWIGCLFHRDFISTIGNVNLVDEMNPVPYNLILGSNIGSSGTRQELQLCLAEVLNARESSIPQGKIEEVSELGKHVDEDLGKVGAQ
ncbi:hypothetical protein B0H14DRAFT_2624690 [Mycena olivaceomarginata]|nr:hypothetical protein B0H14DRAFT_2624690 [Mycena olivaceomarginata]